MKVSAKIIQIDDKLSNPLRKVTMDVKPNDFGSEKLRAVISSMRNALLREKDGVAIAAPQIGQLLSIFVIAEEAYPKDAKWKPLVFINPKIIKSSKKTEVMHEGCLSVRWVYGKTKRAKSVTVEARDESGNKFSFGASGLISQIFQHEIDHLEGVLFIDHGYDFEELTEEEVKASAPSLSRDS